jgi:CRP/FNR family nitrogen fixation transcriptional regulator
MQTALNPSGPIAPVAGHIGGRVALTAALDLPGFVMRFSRGEEVFGEEEDADFVYKVVSGAVRTTRVLSDGRRQISGFHLAGDVFGLELGGAHRFSAEAVVDCEVALVRRTVLDRACERDGSATRELWSLAARDLERLQDHMVLLGRKSALERVASFLLDMARRSPSAQAVDLPMSRTDIADYLGLTIETVSRTFSQMERDGMIALPAARHVLLSDRRGLTDLAA